MWSNTIKIMLESGMRESATKCIPILDESHDHIQDACLLINSLLFALLDIILDG